MIVFTSIKNASQLCSVKVKTKRMQFAIRNPGIERVIVEKRFQQNMPRVLVNRGRANNKTGCITMKITLTKKIYLNRRESLPVKERLINRRSCPVGKRRKKNNQKLSACLFSGINKTCDDLPNGTHEYKAHFAVLPSQTDSIKCRIKRCRSFTCIKKASENRQAQVWV